MSDRVSARTALLRFDDLAERPGQESEQPGIADCRVGS
jgi:hypothetical protein